MMQDHAEDNNKNQDQSDLFHITDESLWERIFQPDRHSAENLPKREGPTWTYRVVHPDGSMETRTGGGRGIIDYLNYTQGKIHGQGELGTEDLADFPGLQAVWIAPYDPWRLPDNPVANHMIRAFDLGETLGMARGIVAFTLPLYSRGRGPQIQGHRLDLFQKIYTQIRIDLKRGDKPRKMLWPSEMITASRGVSPDQAWEELQVLRSRIGPDNKITEVIRERETHLRAGRDPDLM